MKTRPAVWMSTIMQALLFDLGGTFLRAGLAGSNGSIYHPAKTRIGSIADGLQAAVIWDRITGSILAYEAEHRSRVLPDAPIVISFPGPIAHGTRVLQAPTVAGGCHNGFDLPSAVESASGRRVAVLNDVSAAAWRIAETTSARRFLVVTVSSGIGSKIFDRCHPSGVLDKPAYAGEIGHVVVDDDPDAPVCDCGGRGHLGAIASGRGIERIARQKALRYPEAFSRSICSSVFRATPQTLNNEQHIVPAVLAEDDWICEIVRQCTRPLARSLLTVAMALGLEKIFVIGGFASAMGPAYLRILRNLLADLSQYEVARDCLDGLLQGVRVDHETCLEGCAAFLRGSRMQS